MPKRACAFKTYDVRGVVPDELDDALARRIGVAFAAVLDGPEAVVVGRDMRVSSPALAAAFIDGVTSAGVNVVDIGLASTDQLYFASGALDLPGAMFTASHNPAQYGGIKLCRAGAAPVGQDSGLREIRDHALSDEPSAPTTTPGRITQGRVERRDVLTAYAEHLRGLVDVSGIRQLRVVVDAGSGMAGHTVPTTYAGTNVELVPLYFQLDGTFPYHPANPLDPDNLRDLQAKVVEVGADVGFAFDGDADRCFAVDETGAVVSPSALTALIAVRALAREPGATIIHNAITSRSVPEIVREHGGRPMRTRVGHSIIKQQMAETGAVFGGEHSAHFYFRDFWRADSGLLATLHILAALGSSDRPMSALVSDYDRYPASGEINSTVSDQAGALDRVRAAYRGVDGVRLDTLDGLTVEHNDWWFNLRASNTEPLLRLNAEAVDRPTMEKVRDEVLALVRG